jgi:formylglycine-generating enzyme required for sulfatase activity
MMHTGIPAVSRVRRSRSVRDVGRIALLMLSVVVAPWAVSPAAAQSCAGDVNGDGKVDGGDLAVVLANWGTCPAVIQSVSPTQGSVLGGTVITITGTGLTTTSGVAIGGVPCTGVQVLTPTEVRATTPAGPAGPASIAVTTAAGTSLAPTPFTYVQQQVASIVPNTGSYTGGTAITITGQYLAGTTGVTVGGVPCTSVVAVSATQVTAVTPAGSVGAVDVVVSGSKGTITVPGGFTYQSIVVPSWATLLEAFPDPAVVWDANLRAAITATGLAWRVRDTATQMEMLLIPPGSFQMGCSASNQFGCDTAESPVHTVTLTNAVYLGRYEVTQAQWQARMGSNPSHFQSASTQVPAAQVPNRPVEQVSWNMIAGAGGFMAQTGMRLPTEAEWEYAYRAGTTTAFHGFTGYLNGTNVDTLVGNIGWYTTTASSQTRPVGGKAGNGFGLHDMAGNVWEFVNDWYSSSYYASSPAQDPPGPASGTSRAFRGGSWLTSTYDLRSSVRYLLAPDSPLNTVGFRAARNP